jgi:hypothetical protein
LAVDLRQWICAAAMMIDQRLTNASFWTNIKFHRFACLAMVQLTVFVSETHLKCFLFKV